MEWVAKTTDDETGALMTSAQMARTILAAWRQHRRTRMGPECEITIDEMEGDCRGREPHYPDGPRKLSS